MKHGNLILVKFRYLLGGMESIILWALFLSSTFRVRRYFGVLSLNLVMLLFLLFLMVILSDLGKWLLPLLIISMNSFRSFISFGYKIHKCNQLARCFTNNDIEVFFIVYFEINVYTYHFVVPLYFIILKPLFQFTYKKHSIR